MSKTALIIMADGVEDIEAVTPVDILNRVGVKVTVAAREQGAIRGAYGSTILPDATFDEVGDQMFDCVVLPGGALNAQALADDKRVVEIVRRHYEDRRLVAAICASPGCVLAGAADILEGRRATGDPGFNDKLKAGGAIVTDEEVTVDDNIVTGRGPGAALRFALQLTEHLSGRKAADELAIRWRVRR